MKKIYSFYIEKELMKKVCDECKLKRRSASYLMNLILEKRYEKKNE